MTTPTPDQITRLIKRRERLTNRRDERINIPAVNEIDAQLAQLPAGERADVDALLGRRAQKAAAEQHDDYLESIADQYDDMLDWHRICGDLAV